MEIPRTRIMVPGPGGYDVFRLDHTPIGPPGPSEVRVRVTACGINFADIAVRMGLYKAAQGRYPLCPGLEFAGIVDRAGAGVTGFNPGDRVFGAVRFGGYATVINCPARQMWQMPDSWEDERGAAFPVAYLTAAYALFHVGHLRGDDRVLVHSAAGGVGTALLHLLKINGNFSVGVVGRPEKTAAATSAGASRVIDKGSCDLWREAERLSPSGYDLILDANGAATLKGSYAHLRPGGRLLIYGFSAMFSPTGIRKRLRLIFDYLRTPRFNPFDMTGANKTVSGFNLIYLFDRVDLFRDLMDRLLAWDSEGLLPPMPLTPFAFRRVAGAHRALASGKTVGKLVLITGTPA